MPVVYACDWVEHDNYKEWEKCMTPHHGVYCPSCASWLQWNEVRCKNCKMKFRKVCRYWWWGKCRHPHDCKFEHVKDQSELVITSTLI